MVKEIGQGSVGLTVEVVGSGARGSRVPESLSADVGNRPCKLVQRIAWALVNRPNFPLYAQHTEFQ